QTDTLFAYTTLFRSAGNPVSYDAINVTDGDPSTAWRKSSEDWSYDDYILITFDEPVKLTTVGLIPGYAKVDPGSGTDRFFQNHRDRKSTRLNSSHVK